MIARRLLIALSPFAVALASCGNAATGEKGAGATPAAAGDQAPFKIDAVASFEEPWAMAVDAGTGTIFVTERKGAIRFHTPDGRLGEVTGIPTVDYGGQGGLGDFVFAPGQTGTTLDRRTVYLSWAEAGSGDTRGAAVGRADLVCEAPTQCSLNNLKVIWRQTPKVTGRGHYSHRLAFSPDGRYLFVASGDRQKMTPAQDLGTTLGKIVRLLPDGTPAPGNPFADKPAPTNEIWSYGHRNILGLAFDPEGRLWDLEHGPAGGDELNLVKPAANYGWPLVSDGDHYDGRPIPRNSTRPDLARPAITWNPVIAPGDFIFYTGNMFPAWKGQALITGLVATGLVRVSIRGDKAQEEARYPLSNRIREIRQGEDGAIWLLEDGESPESGRLLRLTAAR
ncbi:PQQ-dependent sugar dehydrogenase [Novosphingobium panipatense]|uniref:Glucose/arabinose dehydrogenase, beta-propeller fold n=1 Tax=Novosphingobium panipatense TaxID=428991 RepID=A0ABY1Q286_9SPHN|nr:PQQ-dependent sugar dehydrogenase [Novosphingobium panipatense]SMP57075.1 Glucose/arabinose dehydrogenase, beta-propeller fold [Novosphingobium panipatense]